MRSKVVEYLGLCVTTNASIYYLIALIDIDVLAKGEVTGGGDTDAIPLKVYICQTPCI